MKIQLTLSNFYKFWLVFSVYLIGSMGGGEAYIFEAKFILGFLLPIFILSVILVYIGFFIALKIASAITDKTHDSHTLLDQMNSDISTAYNYIYQRFCPEAKKPISKNVKINSPFRTKRPKLKSKKKK